MPTPQVIDCSHYQGDIDFNAVARSGIQGVIHKCTEGSSYIDPTYDQHRRNAEAAGLLFGAYHFLRPGNMDAQAQFFIDNARPDQSTLLAADYEDNNLSLTDLKQFLREVSEQTKQWPVIYSGSLIKEQVGDRYDTYLCCHRLWLAQYTTGTPTWPKQTWPTYWLWQYTDNGEVNGVPGPVDLNTYGDTNTWVDTLTPVPTPSVPTVDITTTGDVIVTINGKPV